MCETCGCNLSAENRHLLEAGGKLERAADGRRSVEIHNREHLERHRVLAINLMSAPGSGKTCLLEATIRELGGKYRIGVIEGDLETENDADRLRRLGVPAVQITTGSACHLDAHMVHRALHALNLEELDLVFIENVGNLVCPASFDLGQHHNVALLSVTEGDDKPAKYPVMFRSVERVLITKSDLLPYLDDFSPERAQSHVQALANAASVQILSARSGTGLEAWDDWLEGLLESGLGSSATTEKRHVDESGSYRSMGPEDGP
jgi:hydrogenase nickel incorporation protein HypB